MWNFMTVIFRDSTSILFVALGILIMQLGGVINIGAEGMMLVGAFFWCSGNLLNRIYRLRNPRSSYYSCCSWSSVWLDDGLLERQPGCCWRCSESSC